MSAWSGGSMLHAHNCQYTFPNRADRRTPRIDNTTTSHNKLLIRSSAEFVLVTDSQAIDH